MHPRSPMSSMLMVALATITPVTDADTITVCPDGCDHASINAAIEAAHDGDIIQLSVGRYEEGQPIDALGKAITIRGVLDRSGRPRTTLVGIDEAHHVVEADRSARHPVVFDGLAVTNGRLQAGPGTTVRGCWFIGGDLGRGVLEARGDCRVEECTFTGLAEFGLFTVPDESERAPVISGCRFVHNQAFNALAFISQGTVLEDCEFAHNTNCCSALIVAMSEGSLPGTAVTIRRCRFASNQAMAIHGYDLPLAISECIATGNEADAFIHHRHEPLQMERCHLEGNEWSRETISCPEGSGTFVDCAFLDASPDEGGPRWFHGPLGSDATPPAFGGCTFNRCHLGDDHDPDAFAHVDLGGNRVPDDCDPACQADIAGADGRVDAEDLGMMLAAIGGDEPAADLNHDGWVDGTDLGILMLAWGSCDRRAGS